MRELRVEEGAPLYRLSSQIAGESVVRPADPTAVAELLSFRRAGDGVDDVTVRVWSSLAADGVEIWPRADLAALGGLLFTVHDHFANQVYRDLDQVSLDIELKHTRDGRVVLKQVRPFLSFSP